jgi:hypothetical protein
VPGALVNAHRRAPFDLICFPGDSAERFIDDQGRIAIVKDELEWVRLGS